MKEVSFKSFRQKCIENNVDYSKAKAYRFRHPDFTDEQIINYYLQGKPKSFKQKCLRNNINYEVARMYKHKHTELTDEQVIVQFRPDLSINIFGEIVE